MTQVYCKGFLDIRQRVKEIHTGDLRLTNLHITNPICKGTISISPILGIEIKEFHSE